MIPQAIDAANLSFHNEAAREEKRVTCASIGGRRINLSSATRGGSVASRDGISLYPCDEKNRHTQAP